MRVLFDQSIQRSASIVFPQVRDGFKSCPVPDFRQALLVILTNRSAFTFNLNEFRLEPLEVTVDLEYQPIAIQQLFGQVRDSLGQGAQSVANLNPRLLIQVP